MSFFINALALAVPVFVLQVYDRVVFHAGISTLQGLVIGMAVVLVFEWILRQSRSRVMQTVALRLDVEVGRKLFDKVSAVPLRDLENRPAAYWQALFRDVDVVRNTLSGASAVLLADLPFAILFLGLVMVIALPLAWVLAVIVPVFMVVAWLSGHVMAEASRRERDSTLARDGLVAEMISGRTTIKALAMEEALRPAWEDKHASNIERAAFRGSRTDGFSNLGTTLTMLTTVAMTSVGAIAIINQELTIGALIAANMLSARLLGPLNQLVQQWRVFASYGEAVDRLGGVFELPEDRRDSAIASDRPKGAMTLEDVVFAYRDGDEPVLSNVRIKIPSGGVHALVGRNGSGKTTLLKLMQGLYTPASGRILLDDADIGQFSRRELAQWIGYVPQECVLFSGPVRDNISHRRPDSTDEEIIKAAQESGAHGFIVDLPNGYGSDIGEAGRRLSGGQR